MISSSNSFNKIPMYWYELAIVIIYLIPLFILVLWVIICIIISMITCIINTMYVVNERNERNDKKIIKNDDELENSEILLDD